MLSMEVVIKNVSSGKCIIRGLNKKSKHTVKNDTYPMKYEKTV